MASHSSSYGFAPDPAAFYRDRSVTVTGGAGFIGSHLVRGLVGLGAGVRVIDDLSGSKRESLKDVEHRVRFIQASILDADALRGALDGCDIVFHQAALASVPASVADPARYHEVNATGTLRVLQTAVACGVKRVVFASSSSVYGDQPVLPKIETQLPDPLSPYAQQKLAGEHLMRVWSHCFGLSTVCLRYFNIFGPGQRADSAYAAVVAAFATALLNGRRPRIFGDGSASRDFTFVSDVVNANLHAGMVRWGGSDAIGAATPVIAGSPINIACARRVTVLELARTMAELVGRSDLEPTFDPSRPGDVLHSLADIARAREWLGYQPQVSLGDGLSQTLDWYRSVKP